MLSTTLMNQLLVLVKRVKRICSPLKEFFSRALLEIFPFFYFLSFRIYSFSNKLRLHKSSQYQGEEFSLIFKVSSTFSIKVESGKKWLKQSRIGQSFTHILRCKRASQPLLNIHVLSQRPLKKISPFKNPMFFKTRVQESVELIFSCTECTNKP